MPIDNAAPVIEHIRGFVGEELPKIHSYVDWMAERGVTQTSITAAVTNNAISVTTENTNNGVWSGEVQLLRAGVGHLILTLTAGGRVKKSAFEYTVLDTRDL